MVLLVLPQILLHLLVAATDDLLLPVAQVLGIVPGAPPPLVTLPQEVVDVAPCLLLKQAEEMKLALRLGIGLEDVPLSAVDKILQHATLGHVRDDVAIEAPDIELSAAIHFLLDAFLDIGKLFRQLGGVSGDASLARSLGRQLLHYRHLLGEAPCIVLHVLDL